MLTLATYFISFPPLRTTVRKKTVQLLHCSGEMASPNRKRTSYLLKQGRCTMYEGTFDVIPCGHHDDSNQYVDMRRETGVVYQSVYNI